MHRDKEKLVDQGWQAMHVILDKEMPQEKKRRRGFFFLLGGIGAIGIALSVLLYQSFTHKLIDRQVLVEKESIEQIESDNSKSTDGKIIPTLNSNKENKTNDTQQELASEKITSTEKVSYQLTPESDSDVLISVTENKISSDIVSTTSDISTQTNHLKKPIHASTNNKNQLSEKSQLDAFDKGQPFIPMKTIQQTSLPSEKISGSKNNEEQFFALEKNRSDLIQHKEINNIAIENKVTNDNALDKVNQTKESLIALKGRQSYTFAKLEMLNPLLKTPESKPSYTIPIIYFNKPERFLEHGITLGFIGGYSIITNGINYQAFIGYERQISKSFSLEYRLGYGRLQLNKRNDLQNILDAVNPPTLSADPVTSTEDNQSPSAPQSPTGPQGAAPPFTPTNPMFTLEPNDLIQLSSSNLSSLSTLTNRVYAHWSFTRKIGISLVAGIDYLHLPSFDPLYILNETELSNDFNANQNIQTQHRSVDFIFTNQWKVNSGIYFNYAIRPKLTLSGGYQYYVSNLRFEAEGGDGSQKSDISLDQLNLGIRYKF